MRKLEDFGLCPRCETGGPCRVETGSMPGWPDLGFEEGDICYVRPYRNEDVAWRNLSPAAMVRFYRDGRILWLKSNGISVGFTQYGPVLREIDLSKERSALTQSSFRTPTSSTSWSSRVRRPVLSARSWNHRVDSGSRA